MCSLCGSRLLICEICHCHKTRQITLRVNLPCESTSIPISFERLLGFSLQTAEISDEQTYLGFGNFVILGGFLNSSRKASLAILNDGREGWSLGTGVGPLLRLTCFGTAVLCIN